MTHPDIFRDSPQAVASAWRMAAEVALAGVLHFPSASERQARHDYYAAQAARIEADQRCGNDPASEGVQQRMGE